MKKSARILGDGGYYLSIVSAIIIAGLLFNANPVSAQEAPKVLYFPALDDSAVITLTNTQDTDDLATVRAYNANGQPTGVIFRTFASGQTIEIQDLPEDTRTVTVEFNGDLSGSTTVRGESVSAVAPMNQSDFPANEFSVIVVLNPNDSPADAKLIASDKDGNELEQSTVEGLYPMESREVSVKDVFASTTLQTLSVIRVENAIGFVAIQSSVNINQTKSKRSGPDKTATGFYYPTGNIGFYTYPCGEWLERPVNSTNANDCYPLNGYHIGVDIKSSKTASDGGSVYPISDGVVSSDISKSGWGTGNVGILIKHKLNNGSEFLALYGHIIPFQVFDQTKKQYRDIKKGDPVTGGVAFAKIGKWYTSPHLHFGIHPSLTEPRSDTSAGIGWGAMPLSLWTASDTNGFVNPIYWIEHYSPASSTPVDGATLSFLQPSSNTSQSSGAIFTAQITIKNTGSTTWNSSYKLSFSGSGGIRLSGVQEVPVSGTVAPNGTFTFSIRMLAPAAQTSEKIYFETWVFKNPSNNNILNGLTIQIKVPAVVQPTTGNIKGRLHEGSSSGYALKDATVSCAGKSVTTLSDGSFTLSGLPKGQQVVTVSKTGYNSQSFYVSVIAGATYDLGDRFYLTKTVIVKKPNLMPYTPSGWSDKIVISNRTGTTTNSSYLYSTDSIYVDFAFVVSDAPISTTFYTELYVDGVLKCTATTYSLSLSQDVGWVKDWLIGKKVRGWHEIRIKVDSSNAISESNESDNEYSKSFYVY